MSHTTVASRSRYGDVAAESDHYDCARDHPVTLGAHRHTVKDLLGGLKCPM